MQETFDKENWQKDCKAVIKTCASLGIQAYLERSRSGGGGHVWIFFDDKYPAYKSRKIVLEIIRQALNMSMFDKEISFDRLFPNQDYHTNQGFGNLIALPLHGQSLKGYNTVFLDPETFEPFVDQWEFLETIEKLSVNTLDKRYETIIENKAGLFSVENKDVVKKQRKTDPVYW